MKRRIRVYDVIDTFADVMIERGIPAHVRSNNGPEMVVRSLWGWLANLGARSLHSEPCSPWENGYCGSFTGKLRNELLNSEIFYRLRKARLLIEQWRPHYNRMRRHSAGLPPTSARGAVVPRPSVRNQCAA